MMPGLVESVSGPAVMNGKSCYIQQVVVISF